MTASVRVRFAPSPTGFLHIGGVRTALYNWLFARRSGGTFILRIEDTDLARSETRFSEQILSSMTWLGLNWDEGPVYQSQRLDIYREHARRLVEQGKAYTVVEEGREAIKFRMAGYKTDFADLVHGAISFAAEDLGDLVIMKSDGMPTYHFSCVIDDALMRITHVIRGDDHISNTPKQVALYQALGYPVPEFAHIPMILGGDKTRLSKRHGATSIDQFMREGLVPEGLLNYLALLGWSPGGNVELMNLAQMVESFSLDRVIKKSSVFSTDKLAWVNGQHLQKMSVGDFAGRVEEYCRVQDIRSDVADRAKLEAVAAALRPRVKTLKEFVDSSRYFFNRRLELGETARAQLSPLLDALGGVAALSGVADVLEPLDDFSPARLEEVVRARVAQAGLDSRTLIQALRLAVTGQKVTPGMFETLNLIGREWVLERLRAAGA